MRSAIGLSSLFPADSAAILAVASDRQADRLRASQPFDSRRASTGRVGRLLLTIALTLTMGELAPAQTAADSSGLQPQAEVSQASANAPASDSAGQTDVDASLASLVQPAPAPVLPPTDVMADPQVVPQTEGANAGGTPFAGGGGTSNEPPLPSVLRGTIFSNEQTTGYDSETSTVGTIINTPVLTFPGTINTVTKQAISDQQAYNFTDLLRDIGGAVAAPGANGVLSPDTFFLRGLEVTTQNFRRDGFLDPTFVPRDIANIERIDVLKGPSSVNYGAAAPSGTINVVTKRAMANSYNWGGITTGSYEFQRYAFDVNSPLNADKTLLFRINGAYQENQSFQQSVFSQRTFLAPTMTYVLDDKTSISWSGEYQYDRFRMNSGSIAVNGDPFAISRRTYLDNPNGDIGAYRSYRSTLQMTRLINDYWTANVGGSSLFYDTPSTITQPDAGLTGANGSLISPVVGRDQTVAAPFKEQNQDFIANLAGEFETGEIGHKALVGIEDDWFITNHDTFTQTLFGGFGTINAGAPGPFPVTPPNPATTIYSQFDNPAFRQNRYGFYTQDTLSYGKFKLLLASRWDWLDQTYARSETVSIGPPPNGFPLSQTGEIRTVNDFYHWSPKVGLTYEAIEDVLSFYGTYSQSFTPSVGVINFTPIPLVPQIGKIAEGGIKTKLMPGLTYTVGGFHILQSNVNTEFFNNNTGMYETSQAGLQRSQGVEMNLTGQITDRWSTISNWAYVDARQFSINPSINNTRPVNVPMYNGNVWTRYNILQDQTRTAGVALGMVYVGQRNGDYTSPLTLPSYTRWDTAYFYNRGRFTGTIYWENILNTDYVTSSISQYSVFRGAPSNVRLQGSIVF